MCLSTPERGPQRLLLIDVTKLKHNDDLKCDDMGAWKHNGSPKRFYQVKMKNDGIQQVIPLGRERPQPSDDIYTLKRMYYKNGSDNDVRKITSELHGE